MNPFEIGNVDYDDPEMCMGLQQELVEWRNRALGPEAPDPRLSVTLTHAIGLIGAFIKARWPDADDLLLKAEFARLASKPGVVYRRQDVQLDDLGGGDVRLYCVSTDGRHEAGPVITQRPK